MRNFMKIALVAFILSLFLLSSSIAPVSAQEEEPAELWDESVMEGTVYTYEITEFETASGATEALVSLGGGPKIYDNSTPSSLGGQFEAVGRVAAPTWATIGDWRNVLMLGKGYMLEVMVDSVAPEDEAESYPEGEPIPPLVTTYNQYGSGAVTNYFPVNAHSETTVIFPAQLATLVKDTDGEYVTVPATDPVTGESGEYPSFLDFKLTESMVFPIRQYGNATFYEAGDVPGELSSWIPVGMFGGIGYWTLEFRAATPAATPIGVFPFYEVASVGHNVSTGIGYSLEIVNKQMLGWITDPTDPLVAFKFEYVSTEAPYPEPEKTEDDDSPGFDLAIVLLSLASVATIVAYRKRK
jgi:hypothetical protein